MATLGGLGLFAPACGDDSPPVDDPPPTTTDALDTDTESDSATDGLPLAPDPRLFGTFHIATVHPGWSTDDYPDDVLGHFAYRLLTLMPDGLARVEFYECQALFGKGPSSEADLLVYDELLPWTFVPELGGLRVEPSEQESTFKWADNHESMVVVPLPECDGSLEVTTTFKSGTARTRAYRPGRLCAEFTDLETCHYTLDWCDEGEPGPLCPKP